VDGLKIYLVCLQFWILFENLYIMFDCIYYDYIDLVFDLKKLMKPNVYDILL